MLNYYIARSENPMLKVLLSKSSALSKAKFEIFIERYTLCLQK